MQMLRLRPTRWPMRWMVWMAAAMLLIAVAGPLSAQSFYGSVVGTVTDATGASIPAATVTVTNLGTNVATTQQTDVHGGYTIVNLNPGDYSVTVTHTGFNKFVRQPVVVEVGTATRVDAAMQIGQATQTVEVQGQQMVLQTQSPTIGVEIPSRDLSQLAINGRNPLNLAELAPSVVPQGATQGNNANSNDTGWGNYQIGGGIANQSAAFLNGAPINMSYLNGVDLVPSQDIVQEFRVLTNDVSPEYGRFGGGVIAMTTKSGTNQLHGELYEYLRNTSLNANDWFNNYRGLPRPKLNLNQYGIDLGGPIQHNKTFFFMGWEGFAQRTANSTVGSSPTPAELSGNFSQTGLYPIYNPYSCTTNQANCTRTQFPGNIIPTTMIDPDAVNILNLLRPPPNAAGTISGGNIQNNIIEPARSSPNDYNEYNLRIDHSFSDNNRMFGSYINWHKNAAGVSAYGNLVGNRGGQSSQQGVIGDTWALSPTTVTDIRIAFNRFGATSLPFSCCNFDFGKEIGPGWSPYNKASTYPELPTPNIVGLLNNSTVPTIQEADNNYDLLGDITMIRGNHTLLFGGELRDIQWSYVQSNSSGVTFSVGNGWTTDVPNAKSSDKTGNSIASMLLGLVDNASTQQPSFAQGLMWYGALYAEDTWRMNSKLTWDLGVRWEQPGSFKENYDRLTTMELNLPQPAMTAACSADPNCSALHSSITGGLAYTNSPQYSGRDWQNLHWKLFSPRLGLIYALNNSTSIRAGYGLSYLPNTVAFSLGPYNDPVNSTITNMTTTNDGGVTPAGQYGVNGGQGTGAFTLQNPFPTSTANPYGMLPPQGRKTDLTSFLGTGIQSPIPNMAYPYNQQWNANVQHMFGNNWMVDVAYIGAHGVHLPLYGVNYDQLPDQYLQGIDPNTGLDANGNGPAKLVNNPFYGIIPASYGTLGAKQIPLGYLEKPYPQYQYMTADAPTIGYTKYEAMTARVEHRFTGGNYSAAYTHQFQFSGTADQLAGWLDNRFAIGGALGVQDNTNINAEYSPESFWVRNRLVLEAIMPLPFGKGQAIGSGATGVTNALISGWSFNAISTFQSGYPLALTDANRNTLVNNYAAGNAGPGLPSGVTRPNIVAGCQAALPGGLRQNPIGGNKPGFLAFNTACFQVAAPYQFGNAPRVLSNLFGQGIDNTDFAVSRSFNVAEGKTLDFRAEAFNIFNRTQFALPNSQAGSGNFGQVTSTLGSPRALQFALKLVF